MILAEGGAVGGVDVRGAAPATRETDLLNPSKMVQQIYGVVFSGGSTFGLESAGGVLRYLEDKKVGVAFGGMRIEPEPVPLADVAHDVVEELAALAVHHEHALEAAVESPGLVTADRERVLQVARALVDNALVHTPAGTTVRVVAAGNALRVEKVFASDHRRHDLWSIQQLTR